MLEKLNAFIENYRLEGYCTEPRIIRLQAGRQVIEISCTRRVARVLVNCRGVIELYPR